MAAASRQHVEPRFNPATFNFGHFVWDQASAQGALIDCDPKSGRTPAPPAPIARSITSVNSA